MAWKLPLIWNLFIEYVFLFLIRSIRRQKLYVCVYQLTGEPLLGTRSITDLQPFCLISPPRLHDDTLGTCHQHLPAAVNTRLLPGDGNGGDGKRPFKMIKEPQTSLRQRRSVMLCIKPRRPSREREVNLVQAVPERKRCRVTQTA